MTLAPALVVVLLQLLLCFKQAASFVDYLPKSGCLVKLQRDQRNVRLRGWLDAFLPKVPEGNSAGPRRLNSEQYPATLKKAASLVTGDDIEASIVRPLLAGMLRLNWPPI